MLWEGGQGPWKCFIKDLHIYSHGNAFFSEMLGEGGEGSADMANYDKEAPVLHVLVVGFHHKKGCQVLTL